MKLRDIDRNFQIGVSFSEEGLVWRNADIRPFEIRGVAYDETEGCYLRMPAAAAAAVSPEVETLNRMTAGGCLFFRTDSSRIAIRAAMLLNEPMPHMSLAGQSGFDLYRRVGSRWTFWGLFRPQAGMQVGYAANCCTDGLKEGRSAADYMINFPTYSGVRQLEIGLDEDALLAPAGPRKPGLPIVFYGSSITQGACASRPGNGLTAIVSRNLDRDTVNLGFSGSDRGEPAIADYMAGLPMDAFVLGYGANAPSPEHLQATHLPIYRAVRAAHPNIPIVISAMPDPWIWTGTLDRRRNIIRETYETAQREGDRQVCLLEGRTLFAGPEWDACTVDSLHPNDLGFVRIAQHVTNALELLG